MVIGRQLDFDREHRLVVLESATQLRVELWSRYVLSLQGVRDHYRIDLLLDVLAGSIVP